MSEGLELKRPALSDAATLRSRVTEFLEDEADLLDAKRYRDWLALFANEAWYWVPVAPDQVHPLDGPSHLYELRPLLEARVERLMAAKLIPQSPPSRTCRIVGGVRAEPGASIIRARAKFTMVESRILYEADDLEDQRILAGEATYGLIDGADGLRIVWKRVDLITSEAGLRGVTVPL
ncbi:MAG TPA: aromatic-ring-hydroxylating dioxygenase subunit beta [Microvirga sp.]|jgi:3-phenylpropionate/cinnamic acid dioxygenase small subunit|nr:aromatic-ring-hydroxylating dioxygenase subunit beta [Microvirga sp.]